MWKEFFWFELKYQLRQPVFWILSIAFLGFVFAEMSRDGIDTFPFMTSQISRNAPIIVIWFLGMTVPFLFFLTPLFIGAPLLRDQELHIADVMYAMPMQKGAYIIGRFMAGLVLLSILYWCIAIAMMLGMNVSWVMIERQGTFYFLPYFWVFAALVLPSMIFLGGVLSLVAALTRSTLLLYITAVLIFVISRFVKFILPESLTHKMAWFIDIYGFASARNLTRSLNHMELNHMLPSFSGALLVNRAVYFLLGVICLLIAIRIFKYQHQNKIQLKSRFILQKWFPKFKREIPTIEPANFNQPTLFHLKFSWKSISALYLFDVKWVLKSYPFTLVLLITLFIFTMAVPLQNDLYGTQALPTTATMLDGFYQIIHPFLLAVLTWYAGELVFKEKQIKMASLSEALPSFDSHLLISKSLVLLTMIMTYMFFGGLLILMLQWKNGEVQLEPVAVFQTMFIKSVYFVTMAWFALAIQILCRHKLLGFAVSALVVGLQLMLNSMTDVSNLLKFAGVPTLIYSDMNAYGHYLVSWWWHTLYWLVFVVALLIVAFTFWVRGEELTFTHRYQKACQQLRGRAGILLSMGAFIFFSIGGWIFYNTHFKHKQASSKELEEHQARYEQQYAQFYHLPQLTIQSVQSNVDLFPEERAVEINATYTLKNESTASIATLCIQSNVSQNTTWLNLPPHSILVNDAYTGFTVIQLNKAVLPKEQIDLQFKVSIHQSGFSQNNKADRINWNGSFFDHTDYFPHFGYNPDIELSDINLRKHYRLPTDRKIKQSVQENFFAQDANWINFDTTISTSVNQIAVAPGNLQKEWVRDGRRYFHYQSPSPMVPVYAYISGRFQVAKENWNGVSLEVYYDPKHDANIPRMIKTMKQSLDYYTTQFGPYSYQQLRIVEFPRYEKLAQSLPTLIPYSESMGFNIDLRDRSHIDFVTYVTAHEVAHQWWGSQVIPANKDGAQAIVESLSQYSALMVMEKKYGKEKMRRFLKYELETYLDARPYDKMPERPLSTVGFQRHIYYEKASLVLYRLQAEIGEEAVNRALRKFLNSYQYQPQPFPTSVDLIRYLRAETPLDKQSLITDLFEKIVMYNNRVNQAQASHKENGDWEIKLEIDLDKREVNATGQEVARIYDEPIDVMVFSRSDLGKEEDEHVIFHQKFNLPSGKSTLLIHTKEKPYEIGVDPYNLLIDKIPNDNRKLVSVR